MPARYAGSQGVKNRGGSITSPKTAKTLASRFPYTVLRADEVHELKSLEPPVSHRNVGVP